MFCSNCGTQLADGGKFCHGCGVVVGNLPPVHTEAQETLRKQEYVGKILKCPNCGATMDSFATNCNSCGFEIRETKAAKSVQDFAAQLSSLNFQAPQEQKRKNSLLSTLYGTDGSLTELDRQRLLLIESFPIPNTIEDLLEFMILASSNVNMKLYGWGNQGIITASRREISDAWVSKMEQVYQKSKIVANNSKYIVEIEKIYKRVNSKIKRKKYEIPLTIAAIYFVLGIITGFAIDPIITCVILLLLTAIFFAVYQVFFKSKKGKGE